MEKILRTTTSICPECMNPIKAEIFIDESKGENGWVMMRKFCKTHGNFLDKISINPEYYIWKNKLSDELDSRYSTKPQNGNQFPVKRGCPYDCGLCSEHLSAANLMIIDVTNRCNLNCPICFANSNASGRIVEYTYEQVVKIMEYFIKERPFHAAIAQFSGGEPTLHPRIIDILKKAKELGFPHRMLNTNGIRMAQSLDFCRELKDADCGAIYLSWDASSENSAEVYKKIRGKDLTAIKQQVIDNCREIGLDGIMLVCTIANDVNNHEIKSIMEYARANNDIIAGVIFQPVSLSGRIALEDLMNLRYTASDLIEELINATDGAIEKFYPLSFSNKLTQLLIWFSDLPRWSISTHDDCGWATLLPIRNGEWAKLSEFVDVEALVKWANQVWDMVDKREIPKPSRTLEQLRPLANKLGIERIFDALNQFTDTMTDITYRNAMKAYFVAGSLKFVKNFELKKIIEDPIYKHVLAFLNDVRIENSRSMLEHGLLMVGCM
ncbi:MAG: radical SAM protein, partial [Promethearchaeota archaeon]